MKRWTLRAAEESDRNLLLRIYATTRQDELEGLEWSQEDKATFLYHQFTAQDQDYREQFPGCRFQIIAVEGQDIGRLYLHWRQNEIRIVDLTLFPSWRGQGLGTEILEWILNEAKSAGLTVRTRVEEFNPAQRLCRRLGFRDYQKVDNYLLMKWTWGSAGQEPESRSSR